MEIRLTDDEVREALIEKVAEKLGHQHEIDSDACWFYIEADTANEAGEVNDVSKVVFVASITTEGE